MPQTDDRAKWLQSLKVGDEVATGTTLSLRRGKVVEVTKVSLLVESKGFGCIRMRRSNGEEWHQCNYPDKLYPLSECADQIDQLEIAHELERVHWHTQPADKLRRIRAIIKETPE